MRMVAFSFSRRFFFSLLLCCALLATRSIAQRDAAEMLKTAQAERLTSLRLLLSSRLDAARDELANARRSGNISDMASSQRRVALLEGFVDALEKHDDFSLPDQTRRELVPLVEELRTAKNEVETRFIVEQELAAETAGGSPVGGDAPAADPASVIDAVVAVRDGDHAPVPSLPGNEWIAQSADAEQWVTLGVLFVEVSALEVISLSLDGITEIFRSSWTSAITGVSV